MSRKYLVYLLIAAAVTLAGCAFIPGLAPQEKQAGDDIAPLISLPSTGSETPGVISGQAAAVKPFDLDGARWMEYRLTNSGGPGTSTVRLEYVSSSSGNSNMVSVKRTQASNDGASLSTFSGGTLYSFQSSSSQSSMTSNIIPIEELKASDPILYADDIVASTYDAETVTVPKGTYDCKKYMASFKGADAMYWEDPGIPIPVKIYTAYDGTTLELVNWG
jgi:hypothetical protein